MSRLRCLPRMPRPKLCLAIGAAAPMLLFPLAWAAAEPLDFCDSSAAMAMHMGGFRTVWGDPETLPCLDFLLPAWTLDTKVKFAAALYGTALLAVTSEALAAFRRKVASERAARDEARFSRKAKRGLPARGGGGGGGGIVEGAKKQEAAAAAEGDAREEEEEEEEWRDVASALLYSTHVLLGYILMLAAMTYQVEVLVYLVAGLLIGQLGFNSKAPTVPSAPDLCCGGAADFSEGSSGSAAEGFTTSRRAASYGAAASEEREPLV